jgi:photosystem II stability/assembly factor-like uncharacterized protein
MKFGRLSRLASLLALGTLILCAGVMAQTPDAATTEVAPPPAKHPVAIADAVDSFNARTASEGFDRVWQMTGPFGGDVTALAIDPRDPDRVLIGTSDNQIYRSTDGGVIWKRVRPGLKAPGFSVTVILFDEEKPGVIYVGVKPLVDITEETSGGGLYRSEDNGDSWRSLEGMNGRAVRTLVQSKKDPNVLVAAARNGIYRSTDRGGAWERITPLNDPELTGFHTVAIDPRDVNIIYVGTHHLPWKTIDGGQTWKRAGSKETGMIDDSDIMAIHIDESNPDIVLMSACSGIYRSMDASARWAKIQGIPYSSRRTHVIYQHPTRPEVTFAGTTEGLWLSTNQGKPDSWRRVTSLRLVINAIAVHPARPDRVFLGTEDNGVLISSDGGESSEPSNAGFINRQVRAVLADRKEKGRVYAGIIFDGVSSGLFVSEDGGVTWDQSMSGMGVRDVYSLRQSEVSPETLYAGTNAGLYRSDDHGRNWAPVKMEPLPPEAEKKPDAERKKEEKPPVDGRRPTPLPIPAENGVIPGPTYTYETPELEKPPAPGGPSGRPRRVSEKMIKPVAYRVGATQQRAPKVKAPVKSRAKQSASKKKAKPKPPVKTPNDPIELQSHVFLLVPFTPLAPRSEEGAEAPAPAAHWMIASAWEGLFYTADEKYGWKPLRIFPWKEGEPSPPIQPRVYTIATSNRAPGVIYVGAEEGLFVSRDNGVNFQMIQLDEDPARVRSVVFDPRSADTIYVGSSTGFFRSLDSGKTWERRGGGMPLHVDVSGIAISAVNPDELYLSDDQRGALFHSKDRGRNWERLDISQLPSVKLRALESDPFDIDRMYLGSFSGGVYVMSRK